MMEYQRREGCSNLGEAYECLITALFSLRCALSKNVEEFWIASNASFVGDCDDIVLSITSSKGEKIAYLIQLKHMESKSKLQRKQFVYSRKTKTGERDKEKENFSLEKYRDGFEEFQKHLTNSEEKSDIIKELRTADKTMLLYTNKGVETENCDFLKEFDLSENFLGLLGTNDVEHCYGFDHNQLPSHMSSWKGFLQKFYLFANQLHANDVINVMENEIKNYFNLTAPWMINFQNVVKEYLEYVETWMDGYKIGKDTKCYAITKPYVLKTLVGLLLKNYEYTFSTKEFSFRKDTTRTIWKKLVSDKDVTVLNSNQSIVNFMQSYYESELIEVIPEVPTEWNTKLSKNANKRFYETYDYARVAHVCPKTILSTMDVYKMLWMHGSVPLLLQVETPKQFKDILKILEVCNNTIKVIVLVPDSVKLDIKQNGVKYFVTFQDLNIEQQKKLLEVEVNFQGRTSVPLSNLVDHTMYSIIKCHDVINILSKVFIVGSKFKKMFAYFTERSMSRVLLRFEVLELPNDMFLIETNNSEVARNRLKALIKTPSLVHFIKCDEPTKKRKFVGQIVHRLIFNIGNFEWKESEGSIANLRNYVIPLNELISYKLTTRENLENLITGTSKKTKILSAGPGMGKSVMLDFVALFAPKDVWVLQIKLSHRVMPAKTKTKRKFGRKTDSTPTYCDSDISDVSSDDDVTLNSSFSALKYFEELLTNDEQIYAREISLAVLRKFHKANKVLILLDGFDEISIDYKKKVTNMIQLFRRKQHMVWVTTRDHMKTHLEDSLNTLAATLKPFTRNEQKTFLIKYFSANDASNESIVEEFADRLLNAAGKNLSARDGEFTGIPLQTKLLADVFLEKCQLSCRSNVIKFNERFDLLELYDNFITIKNAILVEKFSSPTEMTWSKGENLLNAQKYFALRHVFGMGACLNVDAKLTPHYQAIGRQLIQRAGILVVRKTQRGIEIDFVHRTFAEYLAAQYLSEQFSSNDDLIRTKVLSLIREQVNAPPRYYQFLFSVFDRIVAKNSKLHLSIINIKHDYLSLEIEKDPNLLLERNDFKRSGLHMLALYGKEFPGENLEKVLKKLEVLNVSELSVPDLLEYTALDYCFSLETWTVAHSLCKIGPYLPLKLYDNVRNITSEFVLRTLYHNFCVRAILRGEIAEYDSIGKFWRDISIKNGIPIHRFKFLYKLKAVTVVQYLELVGIKETNATKYNDVRFAVALGDLDNVRYLLDSTDVDIVDVNQKDCNNTTLVHYAIYHNRYDIFNKLITKNGDLHISDYTGNTAIHLLALNGAFEVLDKFWANIVNCKVRNDKRETPLDVAIKVDEFRVRKYFNNNIDQIHESEKMYYAAALGDNKLLLQLLAKEIYINHQSDDNNITALHAALEHNHTDTANILIDHNIDLSMPNGSQHYLHVVAKIGNQQLFEKLLSKGLNIDEENEFGETPLIVATNHGHAELVEFIISKDADVSIAPTYGSALTTSIMKFDTEEIISLILEKGCDISKTHDGTIPLTLALGCEKLDIARLLLKKTPSPDIFLEDHAGFTPLHLAARNGYADLVIYFLEAGINIDIQNKRNETPVLLAVLRRHVQVTEILLNKSANVLLQDNNGNTPLHYAADCGDCNLLERILDKGGDVNKLNNDNVTPFLWALDRGHYKAVNLLLQHGGDLTKMYFSGNSSLHLAARTGNDEIVQKCLTLKMDVNVKNIFQDTPLLLAVAEDNVKTVQLLIRNGANVFQTGKHNNTILHLASCISQNEFKNEILKINVDVNAVNDFGKTPLSIALLEKDFFTAKLLLSRGAKLDIVCNDGVRILHLAAFSDFYNLLLECFNKNIFDVDVEDNRGMSSLEYALDNRSLSCAKLLLERGARVKSDYVYVLFITYLTTNQREDNMCEKKLSKEKLVDQELTEEELTEEELTEAELTEEKLVDEELAEEELTEEELSTIKLSEEELPKMEVTEEKLTVPFSVAKELVTKCSNINELDSYKNSVLINIFASILKVDELKDLNKLDLIWFCNISNLLLDSGADKELKGNRNRSASNIFQAAYEDTNAMSDEQREVCLQMGLVSRLMA